MVTRVSTQAERGMSTGESVGMPEGRDLTFTPTTTEGGGNMGQTTVSRATLAFPPRSLVFTATPNRS